MIQNEQIENIKKLREQNYTYASIGKALGMSGNTVKSVCRKHGFVPNPNTPQKNVNQTATIEQLPRCKHCGMIIDNPWNRRVKTFCSNQCRYKWWNRERRLMSYIPSEPLANLSEESVDF